MIEHNLRHHYQKFFVDPVIVGLRNRLSPNVITWFAGLLGVLVLPALYFNHILLAIGLLLLSGYCDTLDGTLARSTEQSSAWGSVLDITMDRLVEFTVVFALWSVDPTRAFWCFLMLGAMLLCITSFLVVGIFSANNSHKSFHYSPGLMERAEAFVFFIVMMLWQNAFVILAALFCFLVTLTAVVRLYQFYAQEKQAENEKKQSPNIPLSQEE